MEAGQYFTARGSEDELFKGTLLSLIDRSAHVSYRDTKLTHFTRATEEVVLGSSSGDSILVPKEKVITVVRPHSRIILFSQQLVFGRVSLVFDIESDAISTVNLLTKYHLPSLLQDSVILNQVVHFFFHLAGAFVLVLDESLHVVDLFVNDVETAMYSNFALLGECLR